MPIEYTDKNRFKVLVAIIEDYTDWFSSIALHAAYPKQGGGLETFKMPGSFLNWINNVTVKSEINSSIRLPIIETHTSLGEKGVSIAELLKSGIQPDREDFVEFKNLYSSFLASIRRLERDSAMKEDSTDELTGLRPKEAIHHDMNREMERLSRNGNPFALIIARIDGFKDLQDEKKSLLIAVGNVKKSMRPFDDAYYLGDGQFLLSLKHSDMVGADAAAARIQHSLTTDEANLDGLTISCGLAEPVTGDEVDALLENMKNDLDNHADDAETILKFLDISPIERFLSSKE